MGETERMKESGNQRQGDSTKKREETIAQAKNRLKGQMKPKREQTDETKKTTTEYKDGENGQKKEN
jgi:hypothetical protein